MRHRAKGRQLSRTASHKKALLANLATSLFRHDRIVTTEAKAKELRPYAERLITLARRGDLHARRLVERRLKDRDVTHKLFKDVGPRFASRPGGYTRIIKLGHRAGDGAEAARISPSCCWRRATRSWAWCAVPRTIPTSASDTCSTACTSCPRTCWTSTPSRPWYATRSRTRSTIWRLKASSPRPGPSRC